MNRTLTLLAAPALTFALCVPTAFGAPRPAQKKVARPEAKAAPAPAKAAPAKPAPVKAAPAKAAPAATPAATPSAGPVNTNKPSKGWRTDKAAWEGFFVDFNIGYGAVAGEDGPKIPNAKSPSRVILLDALPASRYNKAINTNGGTGLAAGFTIGYNIKGYVSLAVDAAWQGSFTGGKTDMSGVGVGNVMIGLHPLRLWRDNLEFDLKLYGGYGIYDISYYYENQTQTEAKGKSWIGTSIPMGATFYYRIPGSAFVLGADFRQTAASYEAWMYNWDKDIKSEPDPPVETSRVTARLVLGGHF
ncbi:MAG: hypothetical protein KC502_15280 [Myxococcales bacterium]|nr:hypothetical protein [Myxococcales bacterium]